ncbi:MAG: hypothetical protein WBX22_18865 [Silvibacterium sp.]
MTERTALAESPTMAVPRLVPGACVRPFDSAIPGFRFLLEHPSGKRWHIATELQAIIAEIDNLSDVETIAQRVSAKTNGAIRRKDVPRIIQELLVEMGVVESPTGAKCEAVSGPRSSARRASPLAWKIPLLSPAVLKPATSVLQFFFKSYVAYSVLIATLAVNALTLVKHPALLAPWRHNFVDGSFFYVLLFSTFSMLFHELGHASACRHFGVRHGGIGAGLYLCFPVLYADVSDAWSLPRLQRAVVDIGGMYFQAIYAAILMAAAFLNSESYLLWAAVIVNLSCFSNLSPFLRRDGYWLISDLAGIPNLSARTIGLWFGRGDTSFLVPRRIRIVLCAYGAGAAAFAFYLAYGLNSYLREVFRDGYASRIREMFTLLERAGNGGALVALLPEALRVAVPAFVIGTITVAALRSLLYIAGRNSTVKRGMR